MMPLFVTIKETCADGSASLASGASCSVQSSGAELNGLPSSLGCHRGRKLHMAGLGGVRIQSRGVRDKHAWGSLAFLASTPSQLSFKDHVPESSVLQRVTAVAGTTSRCVGAGRSGWETASHAPHSSSSPPETSCPPTAGQAEGTYAPNPLSPPGWQNHLPLTCTKRMELLHPSSSHHAAPNLEGWGSAHPSVTQPDWTVTLT